MILVKLLLVLVLANPSTLHWPHAKYGDIDRQFHKNELKKILAVKHPQEFKFIRPMGRRIPEHFDARQKWPMCNNTINTMMDQHVCNDWAVVPVMVTSDRLCIASKEKNLIQLSAIDLTRCCDSCHPNEKGAQLYWSKSNLITSFFFMKRVGAVDSRCIPSWDLDFKQAPCQAKCYFKKFPSYVRLKISTILIGTILRKGFKVRHIQGEIMKNGPVAGMIRGIPHDLYHHYTDEVYIYRGANFIDGNYAHAIRIIGWGVQNKVPYWLCANTWGWNWGKLGGFFKIRRGTNELEIEEFVIAPDPRARTDGTIFSPTGETKNGISCNKTTQIYKISVIIVLIIFRL